MTPSRWAGAVSGAAALVIAAVVVVPGPAAAAPESRQGLDWGECAGLDAAEDAPMRCARLTVPLDREADADPAASAATGAGTVDLALSRVSAREERRGVLVVNPGGPGSAGRVWASYTASVLPADLRDHYDVVAFDPRGTGASTPAVSCDPDYFRAPRPDTVPQSPADSARLVERAADYAAACADSTGPLLGHMTTADSAADIDAIRAALGVEHIDYLGFSYGSLLGAVYATRYPERVRRLVLDSVVHPGRPWYASNLAQSRALDEAAQGFFAWIARHDDAYGLGESPGEVSAAYYAVRERLAQTPAEGAVGPTELENAYITAAYTSAAWPELARALADYSGSGDTADLLAVHGKYGESTDNDAAYGAYLATQCTDSHWPGDPGTWLADGSRVHADAPFQAWNNVWYNMPCAFWPAESRPWFQVGGDAAPEALLLQSEHDGATPLEGAVAMRERFPGSRLVVVADGHDHGVAVGGNPCVDEALADYLRDGTLPSDGDDADDGALAAADRVCPAPPPPEPEPAAGSQPGSASETEPESDTRAPQAAPRPLAL